MPELSIRYHTLYRTTSVRFLCKYQMFVTGLEFIKKWKRKPDQESEFLSSIKHRKPRHDDVIKWKHFPRYWPFVRGIHRSTMNSPHKIQWREALMFSLICAWINGWVNNREAGDLRRHRAHYDLIVMSSHGVCDTTNTKTASDITTCIRRLPLTQNNNIFG